MNPQSRLPHQPRNRTLTQIGLLIFLVVVCAVGLASSVAQSAGQSGAKQTEEREVENTIPEHLPIKVKIKNWEQVKDLKNENWLGDLEVEVTNAGNKPIYFLCVVLVLPELKFDDGGAMGYQLRFGRIALVDLATPVQFDDVSIQPKESIVLKVPENSVGGWKLSKAEKKIPNPKKLKFVFQLINFGDGTGFMRTDGIPLPRRKKQGANTPCRDNTGEKAAVTTATNTQPDSPPNFSTQLSFLSVPVSFLPANFLLAKSGYPASTKMSSRDVCCPGSSCFQQKPAFVTCQCGQRLSLTSASCSDPFGECSIPETVHESCKDATGTVILDCTFDIIGPCGITNPTPTPTPSATPRQCTQPRPSLDCACNPDLDAWLCKERS